MKSIPFFCDDIKIRVHTATHKSHVGRVMSIREFVGDQASSLDEVPNGDLLVHRCKISSLGVTRHAFIEGEPAEGGAV